MEDAEPFLARVNINFGSAIPSNCLETRQVLTPSYEDSTRGYLEYLIWIRSRRVWIWKARSAFVLDRNVQIDVNRKCQVI